MAAKSRCQAGGISIHSIHREPNRIVMNGQINVLAQGRSSVAGVALCTVLGLVLLHLAHGLVFLSYDLLFLSVRPAASHRDVVLIYLDDRSFSELKQNDIPNWDRNLHAKLLDRMTDDEAKLVVFDLLWDLPGLAGVRHRLRTTGNVRPEQRFAMDPGARALSGERR